MTMELAQAHLSAGRLGDAESACRGALMQKPDDPYLHAVLGMVYRRQRRHADAINAYQRALHLKPDWPEVLNNLGNALKDHGLTEQAAAAFSRAIQLQPGLAQAHNNLGNVLRQLGRLDEAETEYHRSLAIDPTSLEARNNIAGVMAARGELEMAAKINREIIAQNPTYAPAHWDLSLILLLQGDYARGFAEYEWRWGVPDLRLGERLNTTRWDGSELGGKTILLHTEQGMGDAIQFARFAPLVARRGGKVILLCQRELAGLFSRVPGVAGCAVRGEPLPPHDVQAPLLSLPLILGISAQNLPGPVPYLQADETLSRYWRDRFAGEKRRKVGVVWAGRSLPDPRRSVSLAELGQLGQVQGMCWVSLQTGDAAFEPQRAEFPLVECGGELKSFDDTAALMANLDLIVTIDTAAAHLAGAMGKPAFVLLKQVPDWRWMKSGAGCPWYPTLRLFRQPRAGDWNTPIKEIISVVQTL